MNTPTAFTTIPEISLAALRDPEGERYAQEVDRLRAACSDVGFLQLVDLGPDASLFEDLLAATKEFFALPEAEKEKVHIRNSTNHRGYVPFFEEGLEGSRKDKKECFDSSLELPADDPEYLAGHPMLGPNQWPELPGFRETVTTYYEAVREVGEVLFRALAVALGEDPDVFTARTSRAPSQLRLIHYPFNPDAVDEAGIGAHTDFECFTLLRPTAPGLEVLNGAGEWIPVPYRPDALVVNVGDLLEVWTAGTFIATTHRVRNVTEERYSFPLFFNVDYDTVVEPLPRFAQAAGGYEPIVAGEHLYAQTIHAFDYLRERLANGEIEMPAGARPKSSFGQGARHPDQA